jgi:hypothetical protein
MPAAGLDADVDEGDVLEELPDFPPQLANAIANETDARRRLIRRT